MEERTRPVLFSDDCPVELDVGVNSQRIYKVRIKTNLITNDKTMDINLKPVMQVVNAINKFKESVPEKFQDRYKMPEEIVLKDRLNLSEMAK